ncbi:MAG TPA: sulfurtransferase complex subunit TusB [Burkholderiales bacterium]
MSSLLSNGKRMLHVVNKSPLDRGNLASCLRVARPRSGLLLIEDGIFAAVKGTAAADSLKQADGVTVYALWPDVEARGMQDRMLDGVKMVDYGGFVDLVAEHATVQSWL